MTDRDDMVITPRLQPKSETRVRERSTEERRTEGAKRQQRKSKSILQRLKDAHRRRTRVRRASRPGRSRFRAFAGSAAKKAGWALALSEAAITAGQVARAASGSSQRLIAAQDDDAKWFDLDEKARSRADARGFIQSDRDMLRIIGKEGEVNGQIASIGEDMRAMAYTKAVGENLIEIDPAFDSRDTLQDQMIRIIKDEAAKANLKQKADEAMRMINQWLGRGDSGR